MKFILFISVKMSIIVGILTFISRINPTSVCFKAIKIIIFLPIVFFFTKLMKLLMLPMIITSSQFLCDNGSSHYICVKSFFKYLCAAMQYC